MVLYNEIPYVMSQDDLDQMQERHSQTLGNIKDLQNMEQQLYSQLENGNNKNTADEDKQIVGKINELSQMRTNLFKNMKDMYVYLQDNVSESRNDLVSQVTTLGIVESELNTAKKNLKGLQREKYDQLRMVEINTYFGDKYQARGDLMRLLAIFCVPILLIGILANSSIIPGSVASHDTIHNISSGLIVMFVVVGIYFVGRKWWDISNRDNMNFSEYQWNFDPRDAKPSVYDYDSNALASAWSGIKSDFNEGEEEVSGSFKRGEAALGKLGNKLGAETGATKEFNNLSKKLGVDCLGQDCCAKGSLWDSKKNKCMVSKKEAFAAGQMAKGCMGSDNVNIGSFGGQISVVPYNNIDENYASV